MARADVLVVSLGTTAGWRTSEPALIAALERAGARTALATPAPPRRVRTFALTDYVQARACRVAARAAIARHDPRAIVYCSSTAALLGPRPGAIWFDSPAAENRPGRHGIWQRAVERRRMASAPLLLPMSEGALAALEPQPVTPALMLPVPVEPSGPAVRTRDIAALAYAADPVKKGLARILAAWERARRPGETLLVAGRSGPLAEGAEGTGLLDPAAYRALLRRTRAFLAAPLREDYGIAQLEALADGCRLVTTPAPGPYPALALARALDARLVADDLAGAIRVALDAPPDDYAARAAALLAPYRQAAFEATVREGVLPALFGLSADAAASAPKP
ncbi:MAG TPA: hypothetical protein VE972_06005 [Conexibacter sp.]|nr:hypothetical protein [Conexibacter sp.]